ncbi:MAG TPA: hypothetical protein DCW42_09030 [Bacteroidetes bacterium]|nr:hypothetical protein [Bacteroidota bacterium]
MKSLVSIIIPTHNQSKYLEEAIKSIVDQSYDNIEIIVVNDGSTDNTISILSKFKSEIIVINQINQGKSKARNLGIRSSNGEFIAIMDSDDISDKDRILFQSNFLVEHKNIGVVGSDLFYMNIKGEKIGYQQMPTSDTEIRWRSLSLIPCYNIMFRSEIVKKNYIQYADDMPYAEDYAFLVDLLKFTQASSLPIPLLGYRIHGSNETLNRDYQTKINLHSSVIKKAIKNELDFEVETDQTLIDFSSLMLEGVQDFHGSYHIKKMLANFYLDLWEKFKNKYQSNNDISKTQTKVLSRAFLINFYPIIHPKNLEFVSRLLKIDNLFMFHFLFDLPNFLKNFINKKTIQHNLKKIKNQSRL